MDGQIIRIGRVVEDTAFIFSLIRVFILIRMLPRPIEIRLTEHPQFFDEISYIALLGYDFLVLGSLVIRCGTHTGDREDLAGKLMVPGVLATM
jgi:hypothetical protein